MRTMMLELLDEAGQPLTEVELEDYGLPSGEDETEEALDNTGILKGIADLMQAIFAKLAAFNAEPLDPPVHVRVAIGDALFWACDSPETTPKIRIKVKINAES
jgi:hypothetical protein